MIGRLLVAGGAALASLVGLRALTRRGARRLLAAPRVGPEEAALTPALDALGGEVARLRARDGLRLAARWLPAERDEAGDASPEGDDGVPWRPDPHEAVLLLHGYSGSVAPDLVEYGPFLRRTAGVLGLDFRGHGGSDDGPTTFGALEVEDVAGALAWLGERGVTAVALVGTSMGAITALASVAVLGDGMLRAADATPDDPKHVAAAPRPRIVAVVADSVPPEVELPVANRLRAPARRFVAARLFDGVTATIGIDPRATEPGRIIGLVEDVPVLLIHGEADEVVPVADGRRLAALGGPSVEHWVVPGAGHSASHVTAGQDYERRVTDFLRMAFAHHRGEDAEDSGAAAMMSAPGPQTGP